jgi:hypothetical protein
VAIPSAPSAPGPPRPPAGPGKLSQRTDLSMGSAGQPVYVQQGQPYGAAGAEKAAQKIAPLAQGQANIFAPGPPPQAPGPAPAGMANPSAPPVAAVGTQPGAPSIHQLLNTPTRRPQEPVTAGLPMGAGPGPTPTRSLMGQVLSYLASTPFGASSPAVQALALQVDRPGVQW